MDDVRAIALIQHLLDLWKAPYLEARSCSCAQIKGWHDGFLLRMQPGTSYRAVDLARSCFVTPSAVSHVLKELTAFGYVERKPGEDLRSIAIELTPAGVEARSALWRCVEQVNDEMVAVLDPEEQEALHVLLMKLIAGLVAQRTTGTPQERSSPNAYADAP